jgi:SAM-dependent methyltransferase
MPKCCVCNQRVEAWLPHPNPKLASEFMYLLDVVGSTLKHYLCPVCSCNDRDRHLWLYMSQRGLRARFAEMRILHVAPEFHIEALIGAHKPCEYVRGDLHPTRPGLVTFNAEALPFEGDHFDLIICNHVLEHVANPDKALLEFHRTLKAGGRLIAQTPYSPILKNTFEVTRKVAPEFAWAFYGQDDHVRLFGADIIDYFRRNGFEGDLVPHGVELAGVDPAEFGCNEREPFFYFSKV